MAHSEETLQQFMAATGVADRHVAAHYLEMAAGDGNAAALLFFDQQDEGLPPAPAPAPAALAPPRARRVGGGDTVGGAADGASASGCEEAGALASFSSSIASSMSALSSCFSPAASPEKPRGGRSREEDSPRKPDPAYSQTLLTQPLYGDRSDDDPTTAAEAVALPSSLTVSMDAGSSAFAGLYEPPKDLVCTLPFAKAKEICVQTGRWLLVNIQKADEFECHKLNRDIWRAEVVQDLLKEFFVFWQRAESNHEGSIFCELYKVTAFPHIAVIDPRTGRSLKQWRARRFSEAVGAQSELFEFIERQQQITEAKAKSTPSDQTPPSSFSSSSSSSSSSRAAPPGSSPCASAPSPSSSTSSASASRAVVGESVRGSSERDAHGQAERRRAAEACAESRRVPDLQALREKRLKALESRQRVAEDD
ncbi:hypothetical protein BESB_040910 [Besnoitia besnoiti]|uniref:UAS domain-containing protein n=1 Tax=Besnoitia besnoiti TaxID=94643 RepID=A0A2A9MNT5_BESBE|nr:hypothetical protein BESB_040910 [Besnoitia besnoiti]PFH37633.1 hypothetical protein BESB_040910 [Besnoitia besnoiti]